ncbi:hypothetical protein ACW4YW_15180 [Methylobacillus pratensis]
MIRLLTLFLLTSLITLTSCSQNETIHSQQQAFFETVENIRAEYKLALESSNSEYIKKIEAKATLALKGPQDFEDWKAIVVGVDANRTDNDGNEIYEIEAEARKITFYLGISKNSISPELIQNFHKGDQVLFSGRANRERSITISGAIRNPEYFVLTKSITSLKNSNKKVIPDDQIVDIDQTKEQVTRAQEIRDKVVDYLKSDKEPSIKDAHWFNPTHLVVAIIDKGGSYDGWAGSVCLMAGRQGLITRGTRIEIIDYKSMLQEKFKSLGSHYCQLDGSPPIEVDFTKGNNNG